MPLKDTDMLFTLITGLQMYMDDSGGKRVFTHRYARPVAFGFGASAELLRPRVE